MVKVRIRLLLLQIIKLGILTIRKPQLVVLKYELKSTNEEHDLMDQLRYIFSCIF
jgi:hypothetical protein